MLQNKILADQSGTGCRKLRSVNRNKRTTSELIPIDGFGHQNGLKNKVNKQKSTSHVTGVTG